MFLLHIEINFRFCHFLFPLIEWWRVIKKSCCPVSNKGTHKYIYSPSSLTVKITSLKWICSEEGGCFSHPNILLERWYSEDSIMSVCYIRGSSQGGGDKRRRKKRTRVWSGDGARVFHLEMGHCPFSDQRIFQFQPR